MEDREDSWSKGTNWASAIDWQYARQASTEGSTSAIACPR